MRRIPIAKPSLGAKEAQAASEAVLSGWVMQGPRVEEFEKRFAEYVGAQMCAAVSSCTAALHLAMIVSGIGKDDEVICPSMSYIASANAIRYAGAEPVFAEIKLSDYNLDVSHCGELITKKTKAILLVHQMGMPADIYAFRQLCDEHGIALIEDAACAAGSSYKGKKIGSHSDIVCFSFHPRKVITTGEGGMIAVKNEDSLRKIKSLRSQGRNFAEGSGNRQSFSYDDHELLGYNYRMTDIQAAIGIEQLRKLDMLVESRRKTALKYIEELSGFNFLKLPYENEDCISNYQSFCIYLKPECPLTRDELLANLNQSGIAAMKGVMTIHRESLYRGKSRTPLPVSEDASDRSLLLPVYAGMDDADIDFVISEVKNCLTRNR